MDEKTCYKCVHVNVCKHFDLWREGPFPYKTDGHISSYLSGISELLAKNCLHYKEESCTNTEK